MKKSGEAELNHLCGGMFLTKRHDVQYFPSSLPDSVKNWQNSWFYCKVDTAPGTRTLPPYSDIRLSDSRGWNPRLVAAEKQQVLPLMREVINMKKRGLDSMDLIALYVGRRIQPLQARARRLMLVITTRRCPKRNLNSYIQVLRITLVITTRRCPKRNLNRS